MSQAVAGARRALILLSSIMLVMLGIIGGGVLWGDGSWLPGRGLDLAGGRQIILGAETTDGTTIDAADLRQAVEIIRKRIDASGVTEAEITTQGSSNIVVSLPGNPDEALLSLVKRSAVLQFRCVIAVGDPAPTSVATATPSATASESPAASPSASADATAAATETASPTAASTPSASASASPTATAAPTATATPEAGTDTPPCSTYDYTAVTEEILAQYNALDCFDEANRAPLDLGDPNGVYVACHEDGSAKYILGPVKVTGDMIATASSGPRLATGGTLTGDYEVRLKFNSEGTGIFSAVTLDILSLESPRDRFAIMLDGAVISAPGVENHISGGEASITGSFTQYESQQLANQLKFGALPLKLEVLQEEQISATKGAEDLRSGLIAGLVGMVLVVIYSAFQYRALAAVTVGSLVVAGGLTYGAITILSETLGYRLSLAGVIGLAVSIGITADSFIVYFERVKDELRAGRSLVGAVDHAWPRARRTILASDAVNFLAAIVLYVLAVGGVRGFAFTLGLTTLVDLVVIYWFTHPVLVLLARTKFFGEGHAFSGLDPAQFGRNSMYKGRGRVSTGPAEGATLAERKAAKAKASSGAATQDKE